MAHKPLSAHSWRISSVVLCVFLVRFCLVIWWKVRKPGRNDNSVRKKSDSNSFIRCCCVVVCRFRNAKKPLESITFCKSLFIGENFMPKRVSCHKPAKTQGKAHQKRRGSACARGYDRHWQRFRLWYLRAHPLCEECLRQGRTEPARDVDHITPLVQGGARLDPDNVQALCHSCHSRKTATEDGGFGNDDHDR